MKRLVFAFLAIVIVSTTSVELVESAQAKYSGGSGTAGDPYKIANATDLLFFAAVTYDYDKCFILTADIDLDCNLPGGQVFTTAVIARDVNNSNRDFDGFTFTGTFDGKGHKITNLTIDSNGAGNDYLGLFGKINGGEVKNLGLENVSITSGDYSLYLGGLAGDSYYGTISDCYSTGAVIGGYESDGLGVLVGRGKNISNCHSTGTVIGGIFSDALGGLAGRGVNISNCHSTGNVSGGDNSCYLGGLVGMGYGTISNCYSTGTVTGGHCLGGLAGDGSASISGCYSTGAVIGGDGSYGLGGLVGQSWDGNFSDCYSTGNVSGGDNSTHLGGLVGIGYLYYTDGIINCYSTGIVTGGDYSGNLGGLAGYCDGPTSGYFLDTSGPDNGLGTPLTDEEMKQQSKFVGWDFIETWGIEDNQTYPFLKLTYSVGDINRDKNINFFDLAILASHWLEGP